MNLDVANDREMRPKTWVIDLLDRRGLSPEETAVLVKKSASTIWRWRRRGIDYLDWVGLLYLLDLPADWKPGDPIRRTDA